MPASLERPEPLYRQIAVRIERKILTGELSSGDRLPTTQALAHNYGVTVQTAQQAATVLARRGLVERIPGRGSFVSSRVSSRTLGIAFGQNVFGQPNLLFYQQLYGHLSQELKRLDWHTELYFPADDTAQERFLAELGQDVASGRLRGLVALCCSPQLSAWLDEHPSIPAAITGRNSPLQLQEGDAYRGLDYLLARGYRRIAVIVHTATRRSQEIADLECQLAAAQEAHNCPDAVTLYEGMANSHESGGALCRQALDAPSGRPDALLVLNDMACMGAIFALLCARLDIPGDIAIMGCSNRGIPIPCPVPLTRLELDPLAFARELVDQVLDRIDGRDTPFGSLSSVLIAGKSCGE